MLRRLAILAVITASPLAKADRTAVTDEKCRGLGYAFYKMAELRDAGVGEARAVALVDDRLNAYHRTGSHLKSDYNGMLQPIATLAFKRADLGPVVLGAFGLSACRAEVELADEQGRKDRVLGELLETARACQVRHGDGTKNSAASQCVLDRYDALTAE